MFIYIYILYIYVLFDSRYIFENPAIQALSCPGLKTEHKRNIYKTNIIYFQKTYIYLSQNTSIYDLTKTLTNPILSEDRSLFGGIDICTTVQTARTHTEQFFIAS